MSWSDPRAAGDRVFTPGQVNANALAAMETAAPKRPVNAIPWCSHHLPLANEDPNFQTGQRRACTLDRSTRHYANPHAVNGTGHSRKQCHLHGAVLAAAQSAEMNAAPVNGLTQRQFQPEAQLSPVPNGTQSFWPMYNTACPPRDYQANRHLAPCNTLPQYLYTYNMQQANPGMLRAMHLFSVHRLQCSRANYYRNHMTRCAGTSVQSSAALLSLNAAVGKRIATAVPVGGEAPHHSTLSLAPTATFAHPVPNLFSLPENSAADLQAEPKPHFPTHPAPMQSAALSVPTGSFMEMLPPPDALPDAATRERPLPLSARSLNEQSAAWDRYNLTLTYKSLQAPGTPVALSAPGVVSGGKAEERVAARTSPILTPNEFSMQWNAAGGGPVTDVAPLDSPTLPLRLKCTHESDTLIEAD